MTKLHNMENNTFYSGAERNLAARVGREIARASNIHSRKTQWGQRNELRPRIEIGELKCQMPNGPVTNKTGHIPNSTVNSTEIEGSVLFPKSMQQHTLQFLNTLSYHSPRKHTPLLTYVKEISAVFPQKTMANVTISSIRV